MGFCAGKKWARLFSHQQDRWTGSHTCIGSPAKPSAAVFVPDGSLPPLGDSSAPRRMGRQCAHKRDILCWSRPALFHLNRADRRAVAREPSSPAKGPGSYCPHLRASLSGTPPSPSQEEGQRAPKGDFSSRETGLPPLVPTGQMSGSQPHKRPRDSPPPDLKYSPVLSPSTPHGGTPPSPPHGRAAYP